MCSYSYDLGVKINMILSYVFLRKKIDLILLYLYEEYSSTLIIAKCVFIFCTILFLIKITHDNMILQVI